MLMYFLLPVEIIGLSNRCLTPSGVFVDGGLAGGDDALADLVEEALLEAAAPLGRELAGVAREGAALDGAFEALAEREDVGDHDAAFEAGAAALVAAFVVARLELAVGAGQAERVGVLGGDDARLAAV